MKLTAMLRTAGLATLALALGTACAQQNPVCADPGQREFVDNCAVCHGRDGKGGGPYVEWLKRAPPDLTLMSRRNGGVFPLASTYAIIEGAGAGHGTRDMPVWGREYGVRAAEYYADAPYNQEAVVRARILALSEYISRLQAK